MFPRTKQGSRLTSSVTFTGLSLDCQVVQLSALFLLFSHPLPNPRLNLGIALGRLVHYIKWA